MKDGATMILAEFRHGLSALLRGAGLVVRRPRLALLGMVPPLIVSAVMVTLLVLLAVFGLNPLTEAATGWVPESVRMVVRIFLGVAIMAIVVVVAVVTFASVTLAVGGPIYERISEAAEREVGVFGPEEGEAVLASIWRGLWQSLVVIAVAAACGIPVFLLGFIPVLGGLLSVIAGAVVGAFLLTVELISGPFDRRGRRRLREKYGAVSAHRARTLGFGLPVFLVFSIPLLSVVLFPAATAGAALLAADLRRG